MKRAAFLFGSGISRDSGAKMVNEISHSLMNQGWHDEGEFRFVQQDHAEKVKWYRKAAEQNFGLAQLNLGHCYALGEGVEKDEVEAVKWFRRAAGKNYADAQMSLGFRYANGRGVKQDYAEAFAWYKLAADTGFVFNAETHEQAAKACEALEKKMSPKELGTAQKRTEELRTQIEPNH